MTILSNVKKGKQPKPPLVTIYGRPKIGKTTFGAQAPDCLLLCVEKGADNIDCSSVDIDDYDNLIGVIRELHTEDHGYKSVCLDSADWLESIIQNKVAKDNGVESIEKIGYGKGYVFACDLWRQVLSGLESLRDKKGMTIIVIAHDHVKRYDNPMTESYDRYELKLHKSAAALLTEWSDCILFASNKVYTKQSDAGFNNKKTKAKDGGRVIYTQESPAYVAGNRYDLPEELPLEWDAFQEALKDKLK